MGLPEVRVLLDLKADPSLGCERVDALLEGHIDQIRKQISHLRLLERQLVTLREQCHAPHSVKECKILQNLKELSDKPECACHGDMPPH
jgi:hypothetical protein